MKVKTIIISILVAILALIFCIGSPRVIHEGNVGVKYRFGTVVDEGMPAGLHLKLPFVEKIQVIDITEQSKEYSEMCYTKDIQTVENLSLKVNYQYDTTKLSYLIKNVGLANVETKIVKPQIESILKNEIGKYKGEELVANRTAIQEAVETQLRENVAPYGINVISINIQNIDFDDSFETVIAEKVAAEQKLLTAKTEAEKQIVAATGTADAKKIEADAEAYSIQVVNEAMRLMDSDAYVRLQWIEAWDGSLPNGIIDSGTVIYDVGQGN